MHQLVNSAQVVFVDKFVLLCFGTVVDGFVEALSQQVAALQLPLLPFLAGLGFLQRFGPGGMLSHRLLVYLPCQALDVFCWLVPHL